VIAGGAASTTALEGSTEQEQFAEKQVSKSPTKDGQDASSEPTLAEYPSGSFVPEFMPANEESLLPAGD